MNRRNALSNLGLGFFGITALPLWAANWSDKTLEKSGYFKDSKKQLIAEIAEALIPETTTPGAKAVKVENYIESMVKDCMNEKNVLKFNEGVEEVENFSKNFYSKKFADCNKEEKKVVLTTISETPRLFDFFKDFKAMTIKSYTTSEYYLTQIAKFEFVPGDYNGCVSI